MIFEFWYIIFKNKYEKIIIFLTNYKLFKKLFNKIKEFHGKFWQ